MKLQKIGIGITVVSILMLALIIFLKVESDAQLRSACEESCAAAGQVSCHLEACPYHSGADLSWVLLAMGILIAFVGATGVYLILPTKKEKIVTEKEYDLSKLAELEKKIFLYIKKHKEGVYQSKITKEFDLSKVKATRLLDKLEGLDLIERKRRGMTNLVTIK